MMHQKKCAHLQLRTLHPLMVPADVLPPVWHQHHLASSNCGVGVDPHAAGLRWLTGLTTGGTRRHTRTAQSGCGWMDLCPKDKGQPPFYKQVKCLFYSL